MNNQKLFHRSGRLMIFLKLMVFFMSRGVGNDNLKIHYLEFFSLKVLNFYGQIWKSQWPDSLMS